jgi:CRP-like cAMP-binding protein
MQFALLPTLSGTRTDRSTAGEWADVLATFPLFAGTPRRQLRALVRGATFAEYGPGDVVVQHGDRGDSLFVILGGRAKVVGKKAARTLGTGDYFGELGVLDDAPRSASIVASSELHVIRLPRAAFLRLARRDPDVSLQLLSTLGSQFRRLETRTAQA